MSMWSPPSPPPHPQSCGRGGVGHAAAPGLSGPGQPPLPSPSQGYGDSSQGLGKAKLPKLKSPPVPSERLVSLHLCLLCPSGQHPDLEPMAPIESPRTKPVAEPYLSHLGLPAWGDMPGLSVFIVSICAVHWARRPATSAPRLHATIPQQALPGLSQDNCGTKCAQSELSLCLLSLFS